jgi:putative PIN family toxin of toxin-antitoxin system
MIRIVLDTNVVISAHLKDKGAEARVFDLVANRLVSLCVSEAILTEYEGVLSRRKFSIDKERVNLSMDLIRDVAVLVSPTEVVSASSDEPDNRFLECAEEANADYLVTGNKRHFPNRWKDTIVVNARQFLELITTQLQP